MSWSVVRAGGGTHVCVKNGNRVLKIGSLAGFGEDAIGIRDIMVGKILGKVFSDGHIEMGEVSDLMTEEDLKEIATAIQK